MSFVYSLQTHETGLPVCGLFCRGGGEGSCFISNRLLLYCLIPKSSCGEVGTAAKRRDPVQIQHKDSFVSLRRKQGEMSSDGCAPVKLCVL